jgi:hypothetical protein
MSSRPFGSEKGKDDKIVLIKAFNVGRNVIRQKGNEYVVLVEGAPAI